MALRRSFEQHVMGLTVFEEKLSLPKLIRPYWLDLFLGLLFLLLTNVWMLTFPRLINAGVQLVDQKQVDPDSLFSFKSINWLVVTIILSSLLAALVRIISRRMLFNVGRFVERDVRRKLFYRFSLLSHDFFHKHSVGDVMNHMTTDINNVRLSAGFVILNVMNIIIVFGGTIPILISINFELAMASLLPFLLVILSSQALSKRMFDSVKAHQKSLSDLTEHVQENLSAAQVVRVFHQEANEEVKFAKINEANYRAAIGLTKITAVMFPFARMMGGVGITIALYLGGRAVMKGQITLGDFVEVNTRLLQLSWPAVSLGFIWPIFVRSKASLARLNTLCAEKPLLTDGKQADDQLHSIRTDGLTIKIDKQVILNKISLELLKSKIIGVVGLSGSGKSTLIRALSSEIAVPSKQVFYNNKEFNQWKLDFLRSNIAVVSSEPFLFGASLRDNISFAKPDATDEEIWDLIENLNLADDIRVLPKGLDTMIGERGVMLSGGQRQRVALARALICKTPFLFLDDCLSAVDAKTENKIIKYLYQQENSPGLLIVSHRLSALRRADKILVLKNGESVGFGTHEELVRDCRLYETLWKTEKLEESLDG